MVYVIVWSKLVIVWSCSVSRSVSSSKKRDLKISRLIKLKFYNILGTDIGYNEFFKNIGRIEWFTHFNLNVRAS